MELLNVIMAIAIGFQGYVNFKKGNIIIAYCQTIFAMGVLMLLFSLRLIE